MSTDVLEQVVQRSIDDQAFRERIGSDPAGALAGYELTADERDAFTRGDQTKLQALGVAERLSKSIRHGG
jgi:hypothetical protein